MFIEKCKGHGIPAAALVVYCKWLWQECHSLLLILLLFNSYLLACTYAATTDFIELLELANSGAVAACYLREGVALTDSDVASSAVSLLLVS